MKQKTRDQLRALLLLTLVVCTLTGCKKKEEAEELPEAYSIGEETVPALVPDGEEDEEVTVSEEATDSGTVVYTYSGLSQPGDVSGQYAQQIMEDEQPFSVVDEEYVETDLPDFTATEGSVRLARNAAEDGMVYYIQVDWTEEQCTVTVDSREGTVEQPGEKLTLATAVTYLQSLEPSALGLEGTSMDQYQIYALDGAVFVDGNPCLHLKVCSVESPEKANEISGDFLITGDKRHVYSLDEADSAVQEIQL
jgi:hypothetical protein